MNLPPQSFLTVWLTFAAGLALSAMAADEAPAKPCSSPEHRQFDFWVGTWTVRDPQGTIVGTNRIEKILGGCGLREDWTSASGGHGTSLNLYDAAGKRWHQTWIDDGGMLLLLDGSWNDGRMILTGTQPSRRKPGTVVHSRITWTPNQDGTVTQLWEMRQEEDKEWKKVFEGIYTRQPAAR